MREIALSLASEARRAGLIAALREQRTLTCVQLDHLVHNGKYSSELTALTVAELLSEDMSKRPPMEIRPGESVEAAVMRVFARRQSMWLSSRFFVRNLGLRRWTAQSVLALLANRGWLERRGTTSATRYRLVHASNRVDESR